MTTLYLTDAQLTIMRGQVARMLPGTAIIQSATTANTNGKWSETWTPVSGGTVSARVDPINQASQLNTAGAAEAFKVEYQLTVPYNAPLQVGNRVSYDGNYYEVRQLADDHSWNVSIRARIARVE